MSLRSFAGVAVALALLSTPALACKGRNTAFSDDFSREEPSWTTIFGEFGVAGGKATLKSNPGEIAVVANDGDFFESGDPVRRCDRSRLSRRRQRVRRRHLRHQGYGKFPRVLDQPSGRAGWRHGA